MQDANKKNLIIYFLGFVAAILAILAGWAFYLYHQERTTVQSQIDAAVQQARTDQRAADEAEFEEERKNPFRTYTAPEVFGSIEISFPRNWSVYVEDTTSGRTQIDLTIHPEQIRVQRGSNSPRAFRMQLQDSLFENATRNFRRNAERGDLRATTITVSGIEGVRYEGEVQRGFEGALVALPFRDKTIMMWTESHRYESDFNKILEQSDIRR